MYISLVIIIVKLLRFIYFFDLAKPQNFTKTHGFAVLFFRNAKVQKKSGFLALFWDYF